MTRSLFYLVFLFLLTNCSLFGMNKCSKSDTPESANPITLTAAGNTQDEGKSNDQAEALTDAAVATAVATKSTKNKENQKMFAVIHTNKGKIKAELYPNKAPKTVENFVGLAEGTKEFKDPKTGEMTKRRYYDGLTFHRVIPDFMVQGGCPIGNGTGGPGYRFEDEFHPELKHDKAGVLSMANAGPNTNGSQFFITVAPTPFLDANRDRGQGYSIFGQVVEGQDVANAISKVSTDNRDKPREDVVIEKVEIIRQ